jgi:ADP-heptose:LPS heptosyltransferase
MPFMKILILKRDKIGDMLLTTPMLAHLRQSMPDAEIHVLANDYNAWVVQENSNVDRLWVYRRSKIGRTLRIGAVIHQMFLSVWLRLQRFDVVIAANGDESDRAIKRALAMHGKRTIAYCQHSSVCRRLSDAMPLPAGMHETDRMLALLQPLGCAMPTSPIYPVFRLPEKWDGEAHGWLAQNGLGAQGYLVIGLGARRAKKQPTKAQVIAWAKYFKARHGLDTVFMWTPGRSDNPLYPGDDEVAEPVVAAGLPCLHPFRGPIGPALGLIWQARVSIFPDSGLMHFAAASPGGVLGLFAETTVSPHPGQWGPRGRSVAYLEADKSVEELTDEQVFAAVERLIAKPITSANTGRD